MFTAWDALLKANPAMRPSSAQLGSLAQAPGGARASDDTRAVILIGHGSLRAGAGAAMIRLAERAHAAGVAPIVSAGFLNYSQPTFGEALAGCVENGATEVIIQPYFLIPGKYVRSDLA